MFSSRPLPVFGVVVVLMSSLVVGTVPASAQLLSGADSSTLAREAQMTPAELGEDRLDGLQYADVAENLDLIAPPEADNQGGAAVSHPLSVPPGRAGVEPTLALSYDSGGGNGWLGTGWDLGLGSVEVDTRWGSPLFCPAAGDLCGPEGERDVESETYLLDGDQLSPTAVKHPFDPRVADKGDWTRRTETQWERITRRGSSPKTYWWEVTDKRGTTRFYGGTPEGERDPQAILSDDNGNAVRWGLSAVRDISSNIMRIAYDKPVGQDVGAEDADLGTGFYVRSILYTGSLASVPDDPAYEIVFLRDEDLSPVPDRRPDVAVDASTGVLEVTSDLLRRVEVRHGAPAAGGGPRTYDELVKGWNLVYREGAFGKSLLDKVEQLGADGAVAGSHTFGYYDEVGFGSGDYDGFTGGEDWNTGGSGNDVNQVLLGPVGLSALGASETNSGDVHAYIGFNPSNPTKTGSFGGALAVSGGGTGGLVEMMDLNGDRLPDKVYRTNITGSSVKYRLNTSGPGGTTTFGPERDVVGIDTLSTEADIGISGGPEAYVGVSLQFNVAADVSIGEKYFTDVNNDGRPDFVSAGTVYFNTPEGAGGVRFDANSDGTAAPIVDASVDLGDLQALADFEQFQRSNSPLQDVVRRWVAPFAGTVSIAGAATFDPPSGAGSTGDGVRVAVQQGNAELWAASLLTPGSSATPSGVGALAVTRGQAVYFRVGSVDDGARDRVRWEPVVTYTSLGAPPTDANGLSQSTYRAADDFTLAGRPNTPVLLPLRGTVQVEGTVVKAAVTSDDVALLLLHNGVEVVRQTLAAGFVGNHVLDEQFAVAAPTAEDADDVVVRLAADTPVDPTVLSFSPRLYYTEAFDGTEPVDVTADVDGDGDEEPTLELDLPWDIDIYPANDLVGPSAPWNSDLSRTVTVHAEVGAADTPGGDVVLSVKRRTSSGAPGALVAKKTFPVPAGGFATGSTDLEVALQGGADYWFDLTVREPGLSEKITSRSVDLRYSEADAQVIRDVPETLHRAGGQGIFPIAHRGWAYAGYNADGRSTAPIDEQAFVFEQSDYPTSKPTGFGDEAYKDPAQGDAYAFTPYMLDAVSGGVATTVPIWRGMKDNLAGGAGFMSSSRTGADSIGVSGGTGAGTGVRGVRRVGVSAPVFGLVAGIASLSVAFGAGPSFGLLDYVDLNGDSYPDVVAPGSITYTTPRGGFLPGSGDGPDVAGQDTTFAVSGGFSGTAIDVKGNSKGDNNTAQDTSATSGSGKKPTTSGSAQQGESAETQEAGANVGLSLGISAQFTNPGALNPDFSDALGKTDLDTTAPLERELADVNGDGLPDQVVASLDGVSVYFNLGYRFSDTAVKWSGGAFENGESYSGSVGPLLGFNYNNKEFSAGLSYSEGIDQARYTWVDVDGDGVLDRVHKTGTSTKVAFGSGGGLSSEVSYGELAEGELELIGDIPLGEQSAQGRSRGFGGGFDFTIPIGPLCLPSPLCYIIINPGASYERSLSSSQVQLTDVDGDGYPDSVQSTEDGEMTVRANKRGRTNLLQSVSNPLGGEIRLSYTRDGNTEEQPYPVWLMTGVEVDDNRMGDGPEVQASSFTYSGNRYDPVEREILGYDTVVEMRRDGALDAAVLRQTARSYGNDSVFDSGLLLTEELQAPDGRPVSRTQSQWTPFDLATGEPDPVLMPGNGAEALALLDDSRGVVRTQVGQSWFTGDGSLGTSTRATYEYDKLGNVVRQVDFGQLSTPADDVVAETTYPDCRDTSGVSVPATFTVMDSEGNVLRQRDGSSDLCLNSVPIHLEERIDDDTVAVTDLRFDAWGNYDQIVYPENADGERYTVEYVYDADRHTDIGSVVDSHGLTASATYSAAGRVTERLDANGNATRYTYDPFGRLATVRAPDEQGPGSPPTVAYEYHPTAPDYGYAIARHHDRFNPGDTIDTVAFVDGIGRVTQTKHDADIVADDPADLAGDHMLVAGAVEFDALGREVKNWFPTVEPIGTISEYKFDTDPYAPRTTDYTLLDQVSRLSVPNGDNGEDAHVTTTGYSFGSTDALPAGLFVTTTTDAVRNDDAGKGKQQVTYTDVRDNVLVVDDLPVGPLPMRTRYIYDRLGQLVRVVDNAGNVTTHAYDGLGRRLSTDTPDAGLREQRWDPAGNLVAEITPNLRLQGQSIDYDYEFDRLAGIDYPFGTPDVSYAYGPPGAPGNGAGRVVGLEDGARIQSLAYDALGNVATETTTMKAHNLNPDTREKLTYTTGFVHDSLGRLDTLSYPDGEVLSHEYDSGGLLTGLQGEKDCTAQGRLVNAIDAVQTTIVVTELASTAPALPFPVMIDGEQLRVIDRVPTGQPDEFTYTVERGINGTLEVPTAVAHPAGAKVTSDVVVTCSYRYLDRQEYDQFLDRRLRETGNGVLSQWAFDYIGRLETLVTEAPEREVQDITYSYDKVDNVLTMDNTVPPAVPSLYVGPSSQTFSYDPYYRLAGAKGTADVAPGKVRTFSMALAYDLHGNVTSKKQTDVITERSGKKSKSLVQAPTTYTFGMQFAGEGPHQLTKNGSRSYSYDANGNMTGWLDSVTNEKRRVTWDAEDRITRIDDGSDTTDYTYDADGRRAIERGPDGDTLFVNRWYTVRNGVVPWKNIWAGNDRMAMKRSFDRDFEHQQYYLHKDLQSSTNVVTDDIGKVFEHWEYFPGGEPWIREDSNVHRTPYLYAGGYLDDVRNLVNFGSRWYEPREGVFYSPDPILHREPSAAVGDPALLPAYTYAESSPLRLVDPSGDAPDTAGADLRAARLTLPPKPMGPGAATAPQADTPRSSRLWQPVARFAGSDKAKSLQAFSDRFEAKPLVQINLVKTADGWAVQNVKLSPFGFIQRKVFRGAADRDDPQGPSPGAGAPATSPGAGTAAADSGPASAAAAGGGADTGAATPGTSASATPSSAVSGAGPPGSSSLSGSSLSTGTSSVGAANGPPESGGV